jgi:MoxR-like ATPase
MKKQTSSPPRNLASLDSWIGTKCDLLWQDTWPAVPHQFDRPGVLAIRAALASGRPLLLRGESGIGKSQLARAAAFKLGVPFLSHVVDERTERDDLFYSYDAVGRLGRAQVLGALRGESTDAKAVLDERNFVRPGVLWWAFDWKGASDQATRYRESCRDCGIPSEPKDWKAGSDTEPGHPFGPVVLIDEIDKADPSIPNGLLEALGNDGFRSEQIGISVRLPDQARPPLIVITTNEERELPRAFLRRCLVLTLSFPDTDEGALRFLIERARVRHSEEVVISDEVLRTAAKALLAERREQDQRGVVRPGAAEYLDLIGILVELHEGDAAQQQKALEDVGEFVFKKHAPEER